jgi:hypothetical protein
MYFGGLPPEVINILKGLDISSHKINSMIR